MDSTNCKQDIINRALSLLREKTLDNTITGETDIEKLALQWWQISKDEALVEISPPFSLKRETLLKETPATNNKQQTLDPQTLNEWLILQGQAVETERIKKVKTLNKFRIPSNCLCLINLEDHLTLEGSFIYSPFPSSELEILFINRETELYSREVKFNLALSFILAFYMVSEIQNSSELLKSFIQLKNQKISEARTFYQQQQGVTIIKKYQWKKWEV